MAGAWEELNQRQQTYMRLIYAQDQIQERSERSRSSSRHYAPHRSADEWRPILYADTAHGHTPLKQAIKDAGMVDPGTGSTFEALEKRGYIQVNYKRVNPHPRSDILVWIRLTTKGRALARRALGESAPAKLPPGALREWHWRALCRAWVAWQNGERGIHSDEDTGDGFGSVSWTTILRLRDYRAGGEDKPLIHDGKLTITSFGQHYYRENYQRYCEMYPDVDAPEPEEKESE